MSLLSSIGRKITDFIGTPNQPVQPAPQQTPSRMTVSVAQPQGQVTVAAPMQPARVSVAPLAPQTLSMNNQRYANTTAVQAPNAPQYDALAAYDKFAHGALGFPGAVYRDVIKPLPGAFINTGKLPMRVGQLAGTEIVHGPNSAESGQALQNLSDTYQQSIPNGMLTPAWHASQAIGQTPLGGPTYAYNQVKQNQKNRKAAQADQEAQAAIHNIQQGVKTGQISPNDAALAINQVSNYSQANSQNKGAGYNKAFVNAGFKPTDSPFTVGRKFASNAGQTYLNVATLGAAAEAQPAETALGRLAGAANSSGKLMAAANTVGALGQDQVKPLDVLKAIPTGYAQGALLGAALHPADIVGAATETAPKVALRTPEMRINIADQNILRDYTDMLNGNNPAKGKELSDLIGQTQQIGKKYGVDLTNGSRDARFERASSILSQIGQKNRDLAARGSIQNPFYDEELNKLAQTNKGSQGSEQMQHGAAMNDYLFSKSPFATPEDMAQTKAGMAKLEGVGKPKATLKTQPNLNGGAFSNEDLAYLEKLNAQDKANLSSKEQMALANKTMTPLAPQEANTALNPYKSKVTEVAPGDYGHAIANSQLVSRPIDLARAQWERSMKRLTPEERANFWRATEDPKNPNYSSQLQQAINRWRQVDNKVHGESQALGGNTNYLTDHALHPWQLPEEFTQHIVNGGSPGDFRGLNNISRKYRTIAEGEANGLKLGNDPISEGTRYLQANSAILRKAALEKGLAEADSLATSKPHTLDLGNGHTVQLSREGFKAAKGVQFYKPSDNPIIKGIRTGQQEIKSTLLSAGQFHTNNIGLLRAAPTLAMPKLEALLHGDLTMGSHPVRAAVGAYRMYRSAFGSGFADRVIGKAIDDGMVDKGALIGMPYGSSVYTSEGVYAKAVGHGLLMKQMSMMHDQAVRSIVGDLEKQGVPLDSPQARIAGEAGNKMMGFINQETMHIDPRVSQGLSDVLLAKQFTQSKFSQLKTAATKGGVGGSYARANILANVTASAALITGLGYAFHQNSDSTKDMLLRALVDPAVPTPLKDDKGNSVKLRLPGTDTSDVAKLLGIKLVRNADGHLGLNWNLENVPSTVADFARARLGPIASAGVKLGTNTTFAGKPLYDPNAPAGKKAIQAGTSLVTGNLPIGLQGLPQTQAVEKHLPGSAQEVLNAQKPGTNPLLKSFGSSFGVTPSTDATTGKALDANRYFSALDEAKSGLNRQEKDALDLYTGSKKNPVTGAYDVQPSAQDTSTKAKVLLQNPKTVDKLVEMNKKLSDLGQSVDPLWQQPTDKITKYLQYQTMPPGGADRSHWMTQNKDWYTPLSDARTSFFDKLPPGDPNKPAAPVEFPSASPDVAAKQKTFFSLPDSQARAKYLTENPEVQAQLDKQVEYNNQMREAQGYSALDTFPKANPQVQKVIDTYNALPKNDGPKGGNKTRSLWIQSHPNEYAAMTQYFTQGSLYGLEQSAGQAQFKDTGFDQKGLKDLYSLGQYDVQKQTDANGNTFYALGSGDGSGSSGGSSGGYSKGSSKYGVGSYRYNQAVYDSKNPYKYSIDLSTGGGAQAKPKISVKSASSKSKVASRGGSSKPKVTIKRSLA